MIRINAVHKGLIKTQELVMWRVYANTLGRQQEFFNFFCILSAKNYNKIVDGSLQPSPLYQYGINSRGGVFS